MADKEAESLDDEKKPVEITGEETDAIQADEITGERKGFSGATAESETATQTGKMDKAKHAEVKASSVHKMRFSIISKGAPVETAKAFDMIQIDKMDEGAEFDHGHLAIAKPRETPVDTDDEEDLAFIPYLAKLLNRSEDSEWIEKRRLQYKENAARIKVTNKLVCAELIKEGYFDEEGDEEEEEGGEEEEDDDDYDANLARMQELNDRLWDEHLRACAIAAERRKK